MDIDDSFYKATDFPIGPGMGEGMQKILTDKRATFSHDLVILCVWKSNVEMTKKDLSSRTLQENIAEVPLKSDKS